MKFFDKFHAFCFGFLVLLIVITVPYTINHGDFFQNESELIIVSLLVTSLSVTYARKFEDDDLVSPRTNQLMFIGLTGFMSIICLYRGITAGEFYQQLIAYIGAILCLIIMLLLIWGLKYYKK